MTLLGRDIGEIDALVTDRYLDSLLAGRDLPVSSDEAVRLASRRLAGDLPRFHPSFRFEERLALRLAEAAASMRLPLAAGGEREARAIPIPFPGIRRDPAGEPFDEDDRADPRPFLVGGAVAASLSLAGAAWLAWRRRGSGSPMARAARAAHQARAGRVVRTPAGHGG